MAYAHAVPSIVGHATAADGTTLLIRHWPARVPWGHVLLVHGIGEHSGRYEHVGDQMAAAGLDVHAYDHRGTGGSEGRRGHIDRWSQYHDDLGERLAALHQIAAGRPTAIYGHSMGGLIVAGYLLDRDPRPDLAVLSAPSLDSSLATWKQVVARVLGRLLPMTEIAPEIRGEWISRDPTVHARTIDDPDCVKIATLRFGSEGLREQARLRAAAAGGLGVPTLVLHGLDDGLVPPASTEVFAGAPLTERRTYPGLRHELHNEPEGPQVVDEIIAWVRERSVERGSLKA